MKRFMVKRLIAAVSLISLTACKGLLGLSGVECEISGDLWVLDSYQLRIDGVYDQTSGYDIYALIVDGDWTPGEKVIQYIRFPDAEESFSLTLLGNTEDITISTGNSVLFLFPHLGGPWQVEYNKDKNPDEVTLRMVYTVEGVTHNEFIKMKKVKSVKKGQRIKVN